MTIEKYQIPVWALAYIVNADATGYSVRETDMIDEWLELMSITHVCCPDNVDSEKYFEPYPYFGLACDVVECDCYID